MPISRRLQPFGTTIFSEMTQLAQQHGAINLGQGFPDWDGPDFVKDAAARSMKGGHDQYPPSQGISSLRRAVADRYGPLLARDLDPDVNITITAGCTEALTAAFLGLIDAGDEVILIEPYYDSYPVGLALTDARPRYVTLRPPHFRLEADELKAAFSERTKAIVVNTPHNPTGRMFDAAELGAIASLCTTYDAIAITDEVYEDITFGPDHLRLANFDGMWDRTLTLSSIGKTYSLTGWKVGWAIGPQELTRGVRAAHQFMTFTTPTPVQHGAVAALRAPARFYHDLRADYLAKRELLVEALAATDLVPYPPAGTYFVMADHTAYGFADDRAFCLHLVETAGVAAIPPSSFYHRPEDGANLVRLAFCKDEATLGEAANRLRAAL